MAVGIVFDDGNPVFVGKQNQLVPAAFRQRHARRILEVGQHVHELRTGAEAGIELLGEQTIIVDGHGDILRAVDIECLQGAQVGGGFDQDAVAAVDQQFADQIERLLRTGSDEHILGTGHNAVAGKVASDHLA